MSTTSFKSTSSHLWQKNPTLIFLSQLFLGQYSKKILIIPVGQSFLISVRRMQCKQEAISGQGNPGNQLHPIVHLFAYRYISHVYICICAYMCMHIWVHFNAILAGSHQWARQPWQSIASTCMFVCIWLHFICVHLQYCTCRVFVHENLT